MKHPLTILSLLAAVALFLGAGCQNGQSNGPTVSTVGVGGSYTNKDGESYGGSVNVGLAYPTPKPIDRSK